MTFTTLSLEQSYVGSLKLPIKASVVSAQLGNDGYSFWKTISLILLINMDVESLKLQ